MLKYKYLGVTLDGHLSLTDNSNKVIATVASKINTMTYLSKYLDPSALLQIYKTTILPIIEYANCIHSLIPQSLSNKFQKLQNRALRVIYYRTDINDLEDMHTMAKLPSVRQRAHKQVLCLMYKKSRLSTVRMQPSETTRLSNKIEFEIPAPMCERYKNYPLYIGVQLWDSLTASDQQVTFKKYVLKNIDFKCISGLNEPLAWRYNHYMRPTKF